MLAGLGRSKHSRTDVSSRWYARLGATSGLTRVVMWPTSQKSKVRHCRSTSIALASNWSDPKLRVLLSECGYPTQILGVRMGFPSMGMFATADLYKVLGDTFTYGEAEQAGVGDRRLYILRDRGEIIALGGGVCRCPLADRDLVEIAERAPLATPCLATALARHGPIDIAIPRGANRPVMRSPCRLHQLDARSLDWVTWTWRSGHTILAGCTRPSGLYRRGPTAPP